MQELLEYIVKNLVTNPDAVSITEENDNGNVTLFLTVDPKDMGLIIGKGGQTIHAIRKLLTVRAIAENIRINLQLNDPQGGKREVEEEQEKEENSASEQTEDQSTEE